MAEFMVVVADPDPGISNAGLVTSGVVSGGVLTAAVVELVRRWRLNNNTGRMKTAGKAFDIARGLRGRGSKGTVVHVAGAPAPAPEPIIEDDDDDMGVLPNDIDAMFEDDDEDIEPFESLISNDDEEDDLDSIDSPDQMEDPEYIPDVFSPDEQEPDDDLPKKGIIGKIIIVFFLVLFGGLIAGAFFLKDHVIRAVPALEKVYDMVGFHEVGEGLQIQRVEFAQETDQGLEVLVVRGQIENVSDKLRPVPMLRAILFDSEGEEIQHADVAPLKSEMRKGDKMSFKISIKEPSPLRRRIKVTFIDPKEEAGKASH